MMTASLRTGSQGNAGFNKSGLVQYSCLTEHVYMCSVQRLGSVRDEYSNIRIIFTEYQIFVYEYQFFSLQVYSDIRNFVSNIFGNFSQIYSEIQNLSLNMSSGILNLNI
jgi:hypothetical protein